jgi:hypothetical protein
MIDLLHLDVWFSAKEYVDRQLAVMEKYGSKPELSQARYEQLVEDVANTVLKLRRKP